MVLINNTNLLKQIFSNNDFIHKPFRSGTKDNPIRPLFLSNGHEWKSRRKNFSTSIITMLESNTINNILYNVLNKNVFIELDKRILYQNSEGIVIGDLCHLAVFNVLYMAAFGDLASINDENYCIIKEWITTIFANKNPFDPGNVNNTARYIIGKFNNQYKINADKFREANKNKGHIFYKIIKHKVDQYNARKRVKADKLSPKLVNVSTSTHVSEIESMCNIENDNNDENKDNNISNTNNYKTSFIDIMLESQDKNDGKISFDHIVDDIATVFTAGTDTTSATIEIIIYHFILYPKLQEMIYQELYQCIDTENNRYFKLKMRLKCPLFRAFIHESMRIYGIGPVSVPRTCIKDTYIVNNNNQKKYLIQKNSIIVANMIGLNSKNSKSNIKIWGKNVDKFDIYRFIDDNGKFKYNDNFHLFSFGRRDCPGRSLAMKDIILIVSNLIINYKFKPVNNDLEKFKFDFKNNKKTFIFWKFDPVLKLSITRRE